MRCLFIFCLFLFFYYYLILFADINRPVFNPIPEYNSQQKDNYCQSINTSSTDKNSNCIVSKNTDNEISVSRTSKFIYFTISMNIVKCKH